MRVLYVIDSVDRPGGAEQALAASAPHLVRRGIGLEVAYLLDRAGFQDELCAAGVTLHQICEPGRARTVGALRQLIGRRSPDLVHTTLFESDLAGRLAAGLTRTPVCSSLVNAAYGPEHAGDPRLSRWKVRAAQAADAATARLVRRFHAISEHVAATMTARLRLRPDRVEVVPRGRDPDRLATRTLEGRRATRAALGLDDATPVVLAAARHEYQKGLDLLVAAMPELHREAPGAVLVVAGREGPHTPVMTALAARHGLNGTVRLLGPRDDVPALMGAADVFCAPSRWEGLGSAVIEAMGVGAPVVASDVPALREAVGSEECALLAPPGNPAALGQALADTLTDRDAAAARAAAARERFAARYTMDRVADAMIAFYRRALEG